MRMTMSNNTSIYASESIDVILCNNTAEHMGDILKIDNKL